jgi:hypothetical protein
VGKKMPTPVDFLFFFDFFFFAASDFFNKWWVPRLHVPLPHEVALHAFTDKIKI